MLEQIFYGAVIPGFGIGVGYLSTFYLTNSLPSLDQPHGLLFEFQRVSRSNPHFILASTWQYVILPANVVVAFLYLPWYWALVVFPSILPGAIVGGILSNHIGDKNAAWIGPIIGLLIAGYKLITYFVDH